MTKNKNILHTLFFAVILLGTIGLVSAYPTVVVTTSNNNYVAPNSYVAPQPIIYPYSQPQYTLQNSISGSTATNFYNSGYSDGYNKGQQDGYNLGYNDGYDYASNTNSRNYPYYNNVNGANSDNRCYQYSYWFNPQCPPTVGNRVISIQTNGVAYTPGQLYEIQVPYQQTATNSYYVYGNNYHGGLY